MKRTAEQAANDIFDIAQSGTFDTYRFREIIDSVCAEKPAYPIPGPYEIALQLGCALAASEKYDTPEAALGAAWAAVPAYFAGRDHYVTTIVPGVFYQSAPVGGETIPEHG